MSKIDNILLRELIKKYSIIRDDSKENLIKMLPSSVPDIITPEYLVGMLKSAELNSKFTLADQILVDLISLKSTMND